MQYVPWQNVADWHCKACGYCCKLYSVVLNFTEWLNLTKTYGCEATISDLNRFYIKRASDGSCAFLCNRSYNYACALQNTKPEACKIWPFKVAAEPKYGESKQAAFEYKGHKFYVYVDTMCNGVRYGEPSWDLRNVVVKEFVELSLGVREVQYKSTRSVPAVPNQWGRRLFP
jgi:Fe-S-cluster containining protein